MENTTVFDLACGQPGLPGGEMYCQISTLSLNVQCNSSFIDPAGRKHNRRALRCLFSLHISRLQPSGTSLWDEQTHYLATGPRALQGLSVLPLQVLRVISCSAQGAGTSGRQVWVQCPLTSFPQIFSRHQGTCQRQPVEAPSSSQSLSGGQTLSWETRGLNQAK